MSSISIQKKCRSGLEAVMKMPAEKMVQNRMEWLDKQKPTPTFDQFKMFMG